LRGTAGTRTSRPDPGEAADRAARGGWVLTAAFGLVGLGNYFYSLLLARLLVPALFADFAAAQGVLLVCGTVAGASMPWVLARVYATTTARRDRRAAMWFAFLGNLAQGSVAAIVVLLLTLRFVTLADAAWCAAASFAIFVVTAPVGAFQGEQRLWAVAALRVSEAFLKIVVGWVLVSSGAGVAGALAGAALAAATVAGVGLLLVRRDLRPARGTLRNGPLWRASLGIGSVQALVAVLTSFDVVWVGIVGFHRATAGSYQAAAVLGRVPVFLGGALAVAGYAAIARSGGRGSAAAVMAAALRTYGMLAGCFLIGLLSAPTELVDLVFPAQYAAVRTFLPYAAVTGTAAGAVSLATTWFQGAGRFRSSLLRQAAGLATAAVALPVGAAVAGLQGVAIAAMSGPLVTIAGLLLQAPGDARPALAPCLRDAAVLLVLTAVAWAVRPWPPAWAAIMVALAAAALWRLAGMARGGTATHRRRLLGLRGGPPGGRYAQRFRGPRRGKHGAEVTVR
jgi:O-antigen/teichoic acid export membrane protein